jgi:hypothetical protein
MALENSRAGQIGRCLQCRQKFRVPPNAPVVDDPGMELTKTVTKLKALPSGRYDRHRHDTIPEMPERSPRPLFPSESESPRSPARETSRATPPKAPPPKPPRVDETGLKPLDDAEIIDVDVVPENDDIVELEPIPEDNEEIVELEIVPDEEQRPATNLPRPKKHPYDDEEDDGKPMVVLPPPEVPKLPLPAQKRSLDDDEEDEEEEDEEVEELDEEPEPPPVMKPKKKKNQAAAEPGGLTGVHITLIVVGVVFVLGATGLFFLLQHGFGKSKPPDPGPVLAELQKLVNAQVVRDNGSPDRPVVEINLQYCDVKASLLRQFTAFPQLRRLNLAGTNANNMSLQAIEDVTSLEVLNLGDTKVNSAGMKYLKNLTNLQELNVAKTLVDDDGLAELSELKKLKKLNVLGSRASGEALKTAIPGLQVISDLQMERNRFREGP